ncbi:integrase/recombinase XerC [Caloranaerobacter azorensis DSM 13643]|uniref:Integrase/recombinase XerC n=1 Tax=Caloranaerobacter azorensis DSM 13643 TaxID=1121264 RepID=A0A1M5VNR0_9FIRM|nr:tyrosine-type recombinase/integrase [Caloranaerobacter azorensis]SHH76892.1 integrase/recombinase XerC [Caloranaerobacter azorensis DSM 13643]
MIKRDKYIDKYYLKEFKEYLLANDRSEKTIKTYLDNVILFIEYFNDMEIEEFNPAVITPIDILDYRSYCQTILNLSVSSINIRIASLKSYFSWLKIEGIIDKDITVNIKKLKDARIKEPKSFDEKTYRALRRLYYREGNELHICIFELLSKCGLRASELVNLKLDDIKMNFNENGDIRQGTLEVIGKGNKYRSIPLHKDVRKAIMNWIKIRKKRKINSPYLLISERKDKFTTNGIYRIIKKYHEKLQLDSNYSIHTYRHYFCRTLIKNGADLSTVAALAGHNSAVVTSQIYTIPNEKEKQDVIEKFL